MKRWRQLASTLLTQKTSGLIKLNLKSWSLFKRVALKIIWNWLSFPEKFILTKQVYVIQKNTVIHYQLVAPHCQITFNSQAKPEQGAHLVFLSLCVLDVKLLTFSDISRHVKGGYRRQKSSVTSGLFAHRQSSW